jgi:hypothetical protein
MSKLGGFKWNWPGLKKALEVGTEERRQWINPEQSGLSVKQQCDLAGIARSSYDYEPTGAESAGYPERCRCRGGT